MKNSTFADREIVISDQEVRIDRYIRKNVLIGITQSLLESYFRKKLIRVDNESVQANTRVKKGQILLISNKISFVSEENHRKNNLRAVDISVKILYQDKYIIALNKPSGLAVQGGNKVKASVNDMLENLEKVDNQTPKIVHRLDKDTSGVLLLARTLQVARFLSYSFKSNKITKIYRALVVGKLLQKKGRVEVPLAKKVQNGQELIYPDAENGKNAITHFELLRFLPKLNLSYVELRPLTGRKHQIRSHMKYIGNPIYGDKKYGEKKSEAKLALHAYQVKLILPNAKTIKIEAALRDDMFILLQ